MMKKTHALLALFLSVASLESVRGEESIVKETIAPADGLVLFTPPSGWAFADPKTYQHLPRIRMMIFKEGGSGTVMPSINIASQPFKGTLKDYIKIIKSRVAAEGSDYKDLGTLRTDAGLAALCQIDQTTNNGVSRRMCAVLLKNDEIFLISAAASKDKFNLYYKDFFNAFRSVKIGKDVIDIIPQSHKRATLTKAIDDIHAQWKLFVQNYQQQHPEIARTDLKQKAFESDSFQNEYWTSFKNLLHNQFTDMPSLWETLVLQKITNELEMSPIDIHLSQGA
jgi:hypothetical protein